MVKYATYAILGISIVMAAKHIVPFEPIWLATWLLLVVWFSYLAKVQEGKFYGRG